MTSNFSVKYPILKLLKLSIIYYPRKNKRNIKKFEINVPILRFYGRYRVRGNFIFKINVSKNGETVVFHNRGSFPASNKTTKGE